MVFIEHVSYFYFDHLAKFSRCLSEKRTKEKIVTFLEAFFFGVRYHSVENSGDFSFLLFGLDH